MTIEERAEAEQALRLRDRRSKRGVAKKTDADIKQRGRNRLPSALLRPEEDESEDEAEIEDDPSETKHIFFLMDSHLFLQVENVLCSESLEDV